MMLPTRPAASLLFGGVLAAMCGTLASANDAMEIIVPLYQYPGETQPLWVAVKNAGATHKLTGILNPFNGPNVDQSINHPADLNQYQRILHDWLGRGTRRTTNAPTAAPTAPPADGDPAEGSVTGDPAEESPTGDTTAESPAGDTTEGSGTGDPAEESPTGDTAEESPTGDTADGSPTGDNPQRALQIQAPYLTIICYVATNYGNIDPEDVEADIDRYEELFPGVCEGIFLDESSSDITDPTNIARGVLYERYNNYVLDNYPGWTVTFNAGQAVDPEYFDDTRFKGNPTMMAYENFYFVMKNVGIPAAPSGGSRSQRAMLVHSTDLNGATDAAFISDIVHRAYCAGWGKIYLTDDVLVNPWDAVSGFWDALVQAVYSTPDACPAQQAPTLIVPLYRDSAPDVQPVLDVVSKRDYLDKKSVWVIVDADDSAAQTLSDAGARVLCYFDFVTNVGQITDAMDVYNSEDTMKKVCGGFFVDNYEEVEGSKTDDDFFTLYFASQTKIPRGVLVVKYQYPDAALTFNPYTKDFSEVSFQSGPVIVAREVDPSGPFELPAITGASAQNSALIVSGFTETETKTVECVLDQVRDVFDYTYVMGDVGTAAATAYLADLHAEVEIPTAPDCSSPEPTPEPSPTPTPASCDVATGDEEQAEAGIRWADGARKIIISGVGCADLTKIKAVLDAKNIVGPPLVKLEGGVWELDATIEVRATSELRIFGEDIGGECNELRLLTDSTNDKRTRVFGNQGSIEIKNTKVVGWVRGEGTVDTNSSASRGYIYCSSCPNGSAGQCVMSVVNSKIWHLGSGGQNTSGLTWRDRCNSDPKKDAVADGVEILGNRRGIYAHGPVLKFDNLNIVDSNAEGIRLDTTGGYIRTSTVSQDNSAWRIHVHSPAGLEISGNTVAGGGTRSLFLGTEGSSPPKVTGNIFEEPTAAIRIRTPETLYQGNSGDGNLRVPRNSVGCFDAESTSDDDDVRNYIASKFCT